MQANMETLHGLSSKGRLAGVRGGSVHVHLWGEYHGWELSFPRVCKATTSNERR